MNNLKSYLDEWVDKINTPSFIEKDPVQFPRRYTSLQDIEIAAILTATIAWGNRRMILNSAEKMFQITGQSPFDFVMSKGYESLDPKANIHRTFFQGDLTYLCKALNHIYTQTNSLEGFFEGDVWRGIELFKDIAYTVNQSKTKHISDAAAGSACKRLHLALRWLIRNDGIVDLGVWKNISPESLFIPLDVHVSRTARTLGLLNRKSNDRISVEILTDKLRDYCPEDPVKYDFALFGIGESNNY